MSRLLAPLLCCAALAAFSLQASSVQAQVRSDVLLIERVEAARELPLPARGQSMTQVEAQFGAPLRKHAPVGGGSPQHPPISRWDYADYTVYFEHSHVVNAVVRKASPLETGPKPVR